jgi:hypothetical protein
MEIGFNPIGVTSTKGGDAEIKEKSHQEGELECFISRHGRFPVSHSQSY